MKTDFPAAHSMDTHWFAVDRDGHVACFDSGESGAVPTQALDETGGVHLLLYPGSSFRSRISLGAGTGNGPMISLRPSLITAHHSVSS
jgi:hypothetical protein